MKVVAITGVRECALVERPEPMIKDNYVLIKNLVAPMCTEVNDYRTGRASDCLGYEAAGEVVAVAQSGRVKVGDRVVVMPRNGCGRCDLCLAGDQIHCRPPCDPLAVTGSSTGRGTCAQYCFTRKRNTLYAFQMGRPEGDRQTVIHSLALGKTRRVSAVRLLGQGGVAFDQTADGLTIMLPPLPPTDGPQGFAVTQE